MVIGSHAPPKGETCLSHRKTDFLQSDFLQSPRWLKRSAAARQSLVPSSPAIHEMNLVLTEKVPIFPVKNLDGETRAIH